MKKIIAMLLALVLTLSLCACGSSGSHDRDDDRETESTKGSSLADPIGTDDSTGIGNITDPTGTQTPVTPVINEFFNESNFAEDIGAVSVKPRYVHWEDGVLVAECFVINGLDKAVYNITVDSLAFGNKEGSIAAAGFGVLEGLTIAPHSYVVWTFYFGTDCVTAPNADLGYLSTDANTSYNY